MIGFFFRLAYEWEFQSKCWVISYLSRMVRKCRDEFMHTYDHIFAAFQDAFDNHAYHSEKMQVEFIKRKHRIPVLHRNGKSYLISPSIERIQLVSPVTLPIFSPYR